MNPAANNFAPTGSRHGAPSQVSTPSSPYLEARTLNLEEGHAKIRADIDTLQEMYHGLSLSVDKLKKGGWPVHVGPFQEVDVQKSHQSAVEFGIELEKLKEEVQGSVNGGADVQKVCSSTPPHLRTSSDTSSGTVKTSLPPHLRGKKLESTIGQVTRTTNTHQVDVVSKQIPTPALSPPASPLISVQDPALSIEGVSLDAAWKPYHLTTLPAFSGQLSTGNATVTFHPDFLANTLGGASWSPGLRFISGKGPCMLKNRTYYQLDPKNEPYLPKAPGDHGAKLTAFFNKAPEEEYGDLLDEDSNSYEDVPMFVLVGKRYMYYGNYSQTRWSDKLDYDTMTARVPQYVKEYWAEELTSSTREKWVTEELKKHFFRKPEYSGRLFAAPDHETTVDSEEEVVLTKQLTKDVRKYVEELREWEREANMKTAMIKKQSILEAFDASDMDEAPALRLWWEYLECVDWRKDFYELLVTLQERNANCYLQ
ncbi:hypothetical protein J4E83_004485 [Alternaria metachromatica]|uniref:uncharacterized protein n=1 Tax=Alternaria metachromatica TaxID=283354 RepID=UPI0020C275D2|nr:uncharacterized protein J4E83_004485 [Alternaria metachromatica]KAI4623095.1 hypothetical protein J4E83_004485 [Alternaria metachromatica]